MADPTTKTELLKSHLLELTKVHNSYDTSNRIEYTYTAANDALHGAPCLVTRFSYDGVTSRILFAKEYYTTWDSAWDVF